MKCPKCEYLGFESSDRCRNCGYEFSLSPEPPLPGSDAQSPMRRPLDLDRIIGGSPEDLPLFPPASLDGTQRPADVRLNVAAGRAGVDLDDGKPLISAPARPRAPLGVRRATPEVPRARMKTPLPNDLLFYPAETATVDIEENEAGSAEADASASPVRRIVAALIDGAIMFGLDAAVLYFTLRLCNLSASEMQALPLVPLLAFFLMLNGGYFVAFTAVGGQSIGKMALGIKVVSEQNLPVPFGRATLRTCAYALSALPLGVGFLPGVIGASRLAFHDRLAHTRVVRPSSL